MKKKGMKFMIAMLVVVFIAAGCEETHYYRQNNRHSPRYEEQHRSHVRTGVELDIHN